MEKRCRNEILFIIIKKCVCCPHPRISEGEFMEYGDIENHDDFYTMDEGRVHVQDQRGYYIMYNSAVDDFQ